MLTVFYFVASAFYPRRLRFPHFPSAVGTLHDEQVTDTGQEHPQAAHQPVQHAAADRLLRDGDLVLYRRSRSLLYQCRYRLADGTWHRQTTGKASLEHAIVAACDLYDESRYRQRLGLAHQAHSFAHIAGICLDELRHQIDLKKTKSSLNDYASIIERYFVPYFGERMLEDRELHGHS